jgi:hypothetical protein
MKIKVGDIVSVDDTYRIGKKVTVRVTNMNLYPKAETGPRFEGEILSGGSFQKENFKVDDLTRNFGDMPLEVFEKLFPEKLI